MFHIPEYYHNLSMRLSEVLGDIGVNERMIKKRRRSALLMETSFSLSSGFSQYIFGSSSEGTTTIGLKSDLDTLLSHPSYNVIQDYAEWKPGLTNLLMIQNDITSSGYCQLQLIRPDMPLPAKLTRHEHCFRAADGKILLTNIAFDDTYLQLEFKNGPAGTREERSGYSSLDAVTAISCESWPTEARDWFRRKSGIWPTENMKRYVENSGCFVVPVGSKVSEIELLEWRISTSKAERCLMYNLNITQIQCFVLLKMILKTYLQHPLSSFMCKTVLLRCIEKTHNKMWQGNKLLTCLTVCLEALHSSVTHESCPHFFIPGNNLMARQFSHRLKDKLLKRLRHLLESLPIALYGIQIDGLGERLEMKMNPLYQSIQSTHLPSPNTVSLQISGGLILNFAVALFDMKLILVAGLFNHINNPKMVSEKLLQTISMFLRMYKNGTKIERKTLQLLLPFYCSSLGSVLASDNIKTCNSISPNALRLLKVGLNSDVSSGRLKLASVLYCASDLCMTESVLKETERLYRLDSVQPICGCFVFPKQMLKKEYYRVCYMQNEKAINTVCAYCVKFFKSEINCIPHELQYELFRSTEDERLNRDVNDCWMDMAVVDSLPFLYFLQYKTYGKRQSYTNQQSALEHLALAIKIHKDFGHRETALNLLGQCLEQENKLNDALLYYITSLNIRERNNVAKIHICRLLADIQRNL